MVAGVPPEAPWQPWDALPHPPPVLEPVLPPGCPRILLHRHPHHRLAFQETLLVLLRLETEDRLTSTRSWPATRANF